MSSSILVVDDDDAARVALGELLKEEGFSVLLASDGIEALEQLTIHAPDLILSDLDMPRLNGEELVTTLKNQKSHIPVIVITGHTAVDAGREAKRLGVAGFVIKPLHFTEALEHIHRVLDTGQSANIDA